MNINPVMNNRDRIVNLLIGVAVIASAFLRDFDREWVRGATIVLGIVFVVGGVGGT